MAFFAYKPLKIASKRLLRRKKTATEKDLNKKKTALRYIFIEIKSRNDIKLLLLFYYSLI